MISLLFYMNIFISWIDVLTTIIIILAILVPFTRSPISALFNLILVFIGTSILLIFTNVEFLAFTFVVVYIGAIAILFLFIVILFNLIILKKIKNKWIHFVIYLMTLQFVHFLMNEALSFPFNNVFSIVSHNLLAIVTTFSKDVLILTNYLYTAHAMLFLISCWLLLVAMLGAVSLALSK